MEVVLPSEFLGIIHMARKIAKYYGRQKLYSKMRQTFRAFGSNLEPSSVNDRNMQCTVSYIDINSVTPRYCWRYDD